MADLKRQTRADDTTTFVGTSLPRFGSPPPPAPSGPPSIDEPGAVLANRYRLLQLLGEGGMGAVYKAEDLELNRLVALKMIRPELARSEWMLQRFKQELILARRVTHRNVIRIYDLGEDRGMKFITMDFIDGETLASFIEHKGKLPPKDAAVIVQQVCRALEAAHSEGVIHRDLKPGNIMLDQQNRVLVMDFGLAHSQELPRLAATAGAADGGRSTSTFTSSGGYQSLVGSVVGTWEYMAPEQARGEPADARSDIFALGVIFYELLTGTLPLDGATRRSDPKAAVSFKPAIELDSNIPRRLNRTVSKCLEHDPANRYQTAAELLNDVELWLTPRTRRVSNWIAAGAVVTTLFVGETYIQQRLAHRPVVQHPTVGVLVSDFANETSDTVFDATLEPTLTLALEGAPFISSFDRGQAHKLLSELQPGTTSLDSTRARLVAQREGISVVVSGKIAREGDRFRISVEAVDAATGKALLRDQTTSDKSGVLTAVNTLAAHLRKTLGDRTPQSSQLAAEETFTSGSLDAAHEYALGQSLWQSGKLEDSIPHFLKAVQLDPNMGRAYSGLGIVYANLNQLQQAEKYFKLALSKLDRMSDREKYRTRGVYYLIERNTDKAIEENTQLIKQYPSDTAGTANLAFAYFFRRDMAKALEVGRKAVEIFPGNVPQRNNVGLYAMYASDFDTAIREQQTVLRMNPAFVKGYVGLALSQLATGRINDAADTYRKLQTLASPRAASAAADGLADIALYRGRAADASQLLQKAIAADVANKDIDGAANKLATLAEAELSAGNPAKARAAADRAFALSKEDNVLFWVGRSYTQLNASSKVEGISQLLRSRLDADSQAYANLLDGGVALSRHNPQQALALFEQARKSADTWLGRLYTAQAYVDAGAFADADSELEACMKRRGEATAVFLDEWPTFHVFPPVHYYLGRVQSGLGSPAADVSFRSFLSAKANGGPDPLVRDARRRLGSR